MCNFGFAQCTLVGFATDEFESVQVLFKDKYDNIENLLCSIGAANGKTGFPQFVFNHQVSLRFYGSGIAKGELLVLPAKNLSLLDFSIVCYVRK